MRVLWGFVHPAPVYAIYGDGNGSGNCYDQDGGACSGIANVAPVGTAAMGAGLWGQLDLAGEIFECTASSVAAIEKLAKKLVDADIPAARKKVDAAIAGKEKPWLAKVAKTWEKELGLYWSDVLYFDFG